MIFSRCIRQQGCWTLSFKAYGVKQEAVGSNLIEVFLLACRCARTPL